MHRGGERETNSISNVFAATIFKGKCAVVSLMKMQMHSHFVSIHIKNLRCWYDIANISIWYTYRVAQTNMLCCCWCLQSKNSHVSNTTYLWTGRCLALFYFIYDVTEWCDQTSKWYKRLLPLLQTSIYVCKKMDAIIFILP